MKNLQQQVFELVASIGETLKGELHIIDHTSRYGDAFGYRVYHAGGFCFETRKQLLFRDGQIDGYVYEYYADWEGFGILTEQAAIKLLTQYPKV